jgi:hypothetical protein
MSDALVSGQPACTNSDTRLRRCRFHPRDPPQNLRTSFGKIIAKAGVKPWPRLFHNMRASCATDWVERFPAHVVAGWLGHSPMIAAQHYLQVRDAHFDLAAGVGGVGEAAANPATQARPSVSTTSKPETQNPQHHRDLVGFDAECDSVETEAMPPEGLEPTTSRAPRVVRSDHWSRSTAAARRWCLALCCPVDGLQHRPAIH